jgi:hypothetical protein
MLAAAGVGHSRGSLVFVDESAEEVTAAHGPGCCRLLGRGRLVGRSEVERAVGAGVRCNAGESGRQKPRTSVSDVGRLRTSRVYI